MEKSAVASPPVATTATFAILNADKEVTRPMCQSIFRNVMTAMRKAAVSEDPLVASAYTRELFQTQRCDMVADLSSLRTDMVNALGKECTQRIVVPRGPATQEDLVENFHHVSHYTTWHRQKVVSAMDWSTRIRYFCSEEVEKSAAVVGAVAALFGFGPRVVKQARGAWRNYFPSSADAAKVSKGSK